MQAAQIVNEAWKDPDWGALVWLTMVTGHRRGELCGIWWRHIDLDNGVLHLEKSIGQWGRSPSVKQLAQEHEVSVSTAQRAVRLLDEWGLVRVATGRATLVQPRASADPSVETVAEAPDVTVETLAVGQGQQPLDLEVRRLGTTVATLQTNADPADAAVLHRLLVGAMKRDGADLAAVDEYELVVRLASDSVVMTTYVAAAA